MFRRFDSSTDISTSTQVKASVQRALKSQILEKHLSLTEEILEQVLPKKASLTQYKVGPHMMLYCRPCIEGEDDEGEEDAGVIVKTASVEPVLFQHRDGPILPTLRFVHQYTPGLEFTRVTVDKGAIPFLLGGANVMCPGLTNPGGELPEDTEEKPGLEKGDGVVIWAEGKEHALAVGFMTMSSAEV